MNVFSYLIDMGQGRYTTEIRKDNIEEVNRMIEEGYLYQFANTGVVLRAPEDWIVDITDISKANCISDEYENTLAFYLTLMYFFEECGADAFVKSNLIKNHKYRKFDFKISQSERIWGEVRIIGNDNRVKMIRQDIYDNVKKTDEFIKNYKYVHNNFNCKKFNEEKLAIKLLNNYERYRELFLYYEKVCGMKFDMLNSIQMDFFDFPGADCFLFAPKSCFDYMFSIINAYNFVPVSFLEVHAYNVSASMIKCFDEEMQGKKVAVFDKMYSGKTMNILSRYVMDKGGVPLKIGVFPKNITKYDMLDYFIFLDKLLPAKSYHSFLDIVDQVMHNDNGMLQKSRGDEIFRKV